MPSGDQYPMTSQMAATLQVLLAQLTGLGGAVEVIDISGADHTATMTDCRAITCITGTVIKVDFTDEDGVSQTGIFVPAEPRIIAIRNVTKIYKVGTDATVLNLWR